MRTWKQFLLAASATAVVAGAIGLRLARGPDAPEPDDAPGWHSDPPAEVAALAARSQAKAAAVRELTAGRRTLLETAAAFRDLDAQWPPQRVPIRDSFPESSSDDEAYCRAVLMYVWHIPPRDHPAEWVRRLNDELDARRRDGTLRLPEPPAPLDSFPEEQR